VRPTAKSAVSITYVTGATTMSFPYNYVSGYPILEATIHALDMIVITIT
jgi:hypothetical protein